MSRLPGRSLREVPEGVHDAELGLLLRAGFARLVGPGELVWLPLGAALLERLDAVFREHFAGAGCAEVRLPALSAGDSGPAWELLPAPAHGCLTDAEGRRRVFGGVSAAPVLDWLSHELRSYRQLPLGLQWAGVATGPRQRGAGLFGLSLRHARGALFLDVNANRLEKLELKLARALSELTRHWGLDGEWREALEPDGSGGTDRFWVADERGRALVLACPRCGYTAHGSLARSGEPPIDSVEAEEPSAPLEEVATPGTTTIEAVAEYLGVPVEQTLKSVLYELDGELVFVLLRGDRQVNEGRLARILDADRRLQRAGEDLLRAVGIEPGYASPIGIDLQRVRLLVDRSVRWGRSFVTGANKPGYHLRGVCIPRDIPCTEFYDLALARPGDPCPICGEALMGRWGDEPLWSRRLSPEQLARVGLSVLGSDGRPAPLRAVLFQVELEPLLGAVLAAGHDEHGPCWPGAIAPVELHLVLLHPESEAVAEAASELLRLAEEAGLRVLVDDRREKPGAKFVDADLIGAPVRATISPRSLAKGGVELKPRWSAERRIVTAAEAIPLVREWSALPAGRRR
jgi:prolyl-tRNA synthetase